MNDESKRQLPKKQDDKQSGLLDPTCFVSWKNYYVISFLNKVFWIIWLLSKKIGLLNKQTGEKKRVIFIGPTHMGDILFSTPAIRFAKEKKPDLEIICIVSSSSKAIVENNPYLADFEVVDLPWFLEKEGGYMQSIRSFFQLVKVLKAVNAEATLNFSSTSYHREHLAMWLAGIPQRIGFSHKGFGYLLTGGPSFIRNELIARQKLRMVGHWLGANTDNYSLKPDYFISEAGDIRADVLWASLDFQPDRPVIGINPGAQHSYLWPPSHYIELSKMIYQKWSANLLFLGTKPFEGLIEQIRSQLDFKTFSLVGKTSLEEFASILKNIDLVITVDTGARHIANAVGTKAIVLRNGANSIYEFGKYIRSENLIFHEVPCSPCGLQQCKRPRMYCMEDITAEQCFRAVSACMRDMEAGTPCMIQH